MDISKNQNSQNYEQENLKKNGDQEKEIPQADNRSDSKSQKKVDQILIVDMIYQEETLQIDLIMSKDKKKVK